MIEIWVLSVLDDGDYESSTPYFSEAALRDAIRDRIELDLEGIKLEDENGNALDIDYFMDQYADAGDEWYIEEIYLLFKIAYYKYGAEKVLPADYIAVPKTTIGQSFVDAIRAAQSGIDGDGAYQIEKIKNIADRLKRFVNGKVYPDYPLCPDCYPEGIVFSTDEQPEPTCMACGAEPLKLGYALSEDGQSWVGNDE